VAILPFIERPDLYEQYRFDEPWSSEHNRKLIDQMPDIFRSPLAPNDQKPGETNYLGFVGEKCAFGLNAGLKIGDFKDGTSNTLLVVETKATVPWTKPEDLKFDVPEDARRAKPLQDRILRIVHADGSSRTIDAANWQKLAKLISRAGGERVD
jgi:hypothetical protein